MLSPIAFRRYLRRRQTASERLLWHLLRDRRLAGFKFRRQHPIGDFVVDFVSLPARVVIEADGWTHAGRERLDAQRDRVLGDLGYRVLRVPGFQVTTNPEAVLRMILDALRETAP